MRKITLESIQSSRIDRTLGSRWSIVHSNILLVDPQPIFLNLLKESFRKQGFNQLSTAKHIDEARAVAELQFPKLMVVGYHHTDTDRHTLSAFKQDPKFRMVDMLVVTAEAQKAFVQRTCHLNEGAVFCKPVDMGRLIQVATDRIADQNVRESISESARHSRLAPASDKYRRLRQIVRRSR